MSLEVTTRIWNNSNLKSGDKLLLLALGEIADNDGFCWPGVARLAEMTGQSKRQLPRTMNNLRQSGEVIIWDQQGQSGGRGYTNIYFVITGLTNEQIREIVSRRFDLMPDEIDSVLAQDGIIYDAICRQKRVTPATLLHTRKGDTSDIHNGKRVTDKAQKSDTSDTRTIIEPLKESKDEPDKPARPLAVEIYRSVARRYPDKATWPDIEHIVGDNQDDLDRWRIVVTEYIKCGWNKINISGMLNFFEKNQIPTTEPIQKGQRDNGTKTTLSGEKLKRYQELVEGST